MGGWMGGWESRVKDCLQQSKIFIYKIVQLRRKNSIIPVLESLKQDGGPFKI
jgi:hypothetical protein